MRIKLGIAYTLLSALGYASTAVLIIKAYRGGATPWQVLLVQNTFNILLTVILSFVRRKELSRLRKDLPAIILVGLVGYGSMAVCYSLSLQYIPGAVATLIFFSYPLLVTLGARFFYGERLTPRKLSALILAFSGVLLTSEMKVSGLSWSRVSGIFLCLLAAVGAAIMSLASQKLLADNDSLDVAVVQQFVASSFLVAGILGAGLAGWAPGDDPVWRWGLLLALITSLLPTFLSLKGISYLGSYASSIVATAEIPFTLILVFVFLRERLGGLQWLGSALILAGVLVLRKRSINFSREV